MKDLLIRCTSCKLLFEGIELKGICPRCARPFLELAATYPYLKEEELETNTERQTVT